jgi:uncharacterized membrane protein
VLGFVFTAFLPGYCLVKVLFVKEKDGEFFLILKLVLSVALSFGLAGIFGLFLGLSPIGISNTSIPITLGAITLVLAVIAYFRAIKALRQPNMQSPQQVSS